MGKIEQHPCQFIRSFNTDPPPLISMNSLETLKSTRHMGQNQLGVYVVLRSQRSRTTFFLISKVLKSWIVSTFQPVYLGWYVSSMRFMLCTRIVCKSHFPSNNFSYDSVEHVRGRRLDSIEEDLRKIPNILFFSRTLYDFDDNGRTCVIPYTIHTED